MKNSEWMKRIALLVLALALSGCATIEKLKDKFEDSPVKIDQANNRLKNPGRIIVWFGSGKEIWQRDTGYYAGALGDRKAYNFEKKLVDQWNDMCSIYESISNDKSLREGGPEILAVYTEVNTWWNPSPGKSYYKDTGEKTDRVPDVATYRIITKSGHTFRFTIRNRGDYVGDPGNGFGYVLDAKGETRAAWSFNRTQWNGKSVGFRN